MNKQFKAMLAKDADFDKLRFPLLASPKLDGVRATVIDGVVMSRSLKPIPNKHVQALFANCEYFDGELIVGDPTSKTAYLDTVSFVMSQDKVGECTYFVFDHVEFPENNFPDRIKEVDSYIHPAVLKLEQRLISNMDELLAYETECLELGYEGLITRDPNTAYKYGRATANSQELNKVKRFEDAEAIIVGFDERMHNANEKFTNELGRSARSSHAAGKVPMGTLGALQCVIDGIEFNIGTGFNDELRSHIWSNRSSYLGKLVKFKFFPVGTHEAPRHPVYLGMRDPIDLS